MMRHTEHHHPQNQMQRNTRMGLQQMGPPPTTSRTQPMIMSIQPTVPVPHTDQNSCQKLVEICADFVVCNGDKLRNFYYDKYRKTWDLINKHTCTTEERAQCDKVFEDIRRKLKWLTMIDDGHITVEAIEELYGSSEVFIIENHLNNLLDQSTFTLSQELQEVIKKYLYHYT